MKILILSCNTGEGHNAAGKAIREAAIRCGHTADMLDMFLLSGKKTSHAVGGAYVELVKHMPHAFGMLYKIGMAISSNKHDDIIITGLLCQCTDGKKTGCLFKPA